MSDIFGGADNDILGGTSNDDLMKGYGGDDEFSGGGGNDELVGGGGIDLLNGEAGNDTLKGGGGNDTLNGGAGNDIDILIGGKGADTLDGGEGNDIYEVSVKDLDIPATDTYNDTGLSEGDEIDADKVLQLMLGDFDATTGIDSIRGHETNGLEIISDGHAVNWDFTGVDLEHISQITGSGEDDSITGSDGDDKVKGGGGDDELNGGDGDDNLIGGGGNDDMDGGDGDDKVKGGGGDDTLTGGAGNDTLTGGTGNDIMDGGEGSDTYVYKPGDTLDDDDLEDTGTSGTDVVDVSALAEIVLGDDISAGGAGIEEVHGAETGTVLLADEDSTGVFWDFSDAELVDISQITGSDGNDIITGSDSDDKIKGGAGVDVLSGADGDDNLSGGGGVDTVAGGAGDDIVKGGGGDDLLEGGAGNDTLRGGGGNDTLEYDAADGEVDGQDGVDELTLDGVSNATLDITESAGVTFMNIEVIDLDDDGNTVVLDKTSVKNMSTTSDTLMINGGASDAVTSSFEWDSTGTPVEGYNVYTSGSVTLMVQVGVNVSGLNTTANEAPVAEVINTDLQVDEGGSVNLATLIGATDVDDDPAGIIYTVSTVPTNGQVELVSAPGTPITSFTQAQLNAGDVVYVSDTNDATSDSFGLTVDDGNEDASAPEEVIFNVVINADITGGNGNDTLNGGLGDDTLNGSVGNDTLNGNEGDDTLNGGDHNDTLHGGAGDDALNGGNGEDTADYAAVTGPMTVNLFFGTANGDGDDTLSGVENVSGGSGNDILIGDSVANLLEGNGGDDVIIGGTGNDDMDGGDGMDTLDYTGVSANLMVNTAAGTATGEGDDIFADFEVILGGSGGDTFLVNTADAVVHGGDGTDTISAGGAGDDLFYGDGGNDTLNGGFGDDVLWGGDGDDTLTGGANNDGSGADTLHGGAGDDTLVGGPADDVLDGGADVDTANYSAAVAAVIVDLVEGTATGGAGNDTLIDVENVIGTAGDDVFVGNGSDNRFYGGAGNDTFSGGAGNDHFYGETGTGDLVDYSDATEGAAIHLDSGSAFIGETEEDSFIGIEHVIGSDFDDDIRGDAGENVLNGGGGNDTIRGGAGNDDLDGGDGIDTLDYSTVSANLNINTASDSAIGEGTDTFVGFEAIIGGSGNDFILVNAAEAMVYGGGGADTISAGGSGDDLYFGDGGNDTLNGGFGNDVLHGGDGSDTLTGGLDNDVSGDDRLYGGANDDFLHAGPGNDYLDGGTGGDYFYNGAVTAGDDTFVGGDGFDRVWYTSVTTNLNVDMTTGTVTGAGTDTLLEIEQVIGGSGHDVFIGSSGNDNFQGGGGGNDEMSGNEGNDVLSAEGGNDTVNGGLGNDDMHDGTGNDTYVFDTALGATNVDRIIGFEGAGFGSDADEILLDNTIFTVLADGFLPSQNFESGSGLTQAATSDGRIIYDIDTGNLYYDVDGVGGTAAVQFAQLTTHPDELDATDFSVI